MRQQHDASSFRGADEDPRVRRTRRALQQALAELADERANVTMSAVAQRAGLSRQVLHTHYSSLGELASETLVRRIVEGTGHHVSSDVRSAMPALVAAVRSEGLTPFLQFIRDDREVFLALRTIAHRQSAAVLAQVFAGRFLDTDPTRNSVRRRSSPPVDDDRRRAMARRRGCSTRSTPSGASRAIRPRRAHCRHRPALNGRAGSHFDPEPNGPRQTLRCSDVEELDCAGAVEDMGSRMLTCPAWPPGVPTRANRANASCTSSARCCGGWGPVKSSTPSARRVLKMNGTSSEWADPIPGAAVDSHRNSYRNVGAQASALASTNACVGRRNILSAIADPRESARSER